jgi:DNA-binding response OmpR family regulator
MQAITAHLVRLVRRTGWLPVVLLAGLVGAGDFVSAGEPVELTVGEDGIQRGTVTLDSYSYSPNHLIVRAGKPVELTRKEYELLLYFLANKNRVITKSSVAERLWGDDMDETDSYDFIYTHIKNLRKKLTEKGCEDYLQTIYGIGYKFKTP